MSDDLYELVESGRAFEFGLMDYAAPKGATAEAAVLQAIADRGFEVFYSKRVTYPTGPGGFYAIAGPTDED